MALNAPAPAVRTGVCAPLGFRAGVAAAGIRDGGQAARLDVAVVASDVPCTGAGVFTRNVVKAAPVVISQLTLRRRGAIRAVVINSGNANACTGPQGFRDALRMATVAADRCGVDPSEVLICSTGVIGRPMPMDRVRAGIAEAARTLADDGGDAAVAIMTTDTVPKTAMATALIDGVVCTVGGMAKGAGMIHPDMATLLALVTTDAAVDREVLQTMLADICGRTFNCLSIDGDTSTNDSLLLLANGAAGAPSIDDVRSPQSMALCDAIEEVCLSLVEQLAADAEGATTSIVVDVEDAVDVLQARQAARTVVLSPLVKTAVHGRDPNWGRIVAALGRSGASFSLDRCEVWLGDVTVFAGGGAVDVDLDTVRRALSGPRVVITIRLHAGEARGRAWGCDLSADYVSINADYTT